MVNTEFSFNKFHILSYLLFNVFLCGVIGLLEEALHRPLHYFVYMPHANELPLHHLLAKIYGKLLASCENLLIVKFEPIGELNLDNEPSNQSTDQMHLYKTWGSGSGAIVSGEFSKEASW